MRKIFKLIVSITVLVSLTGCIPSGNVVGKANFITSESNFASEGDIATIDINGGVVATPKGLRFRVTKASFYANGVYIIAAKNNFLEPYDFTKNDFASARLKGKNICGSLGGYTVDGVQFALLLAAPKGETQFLYIQTDNNLYWIGQASPNSLKVGGRNLCGGDNG